MSRKITRTTKEKVELRDNMMKYNDNDKSNGSEELR